MPDPQPIPQARFTLTHAGIATAVVFWLGESLLHLIAFKPHHFELLPEDGHELWMRTFICALFVIFGIYANRVVRRLRNSEAELAKANLELGIALNKAIKGHLPVCAWCKSIRNKQGQWVRMEIYLRDQTGTELTHGLCEVCARKIAEEEQIPDEVN